jgi:drug/metabolite transporter (DMT)-like permease
MIPQRPENVVPAILLSLLALVLFDLMGLIIKHLSEDYSAAELSAYRNFFGLIPSVIALSSSRQWHQKGRMIRMRQWQIACLRGVLVTFAQFLFYLSLGRLAFATASTITYSNALFMTALAVPLLGERVGVARWLAVGVGFIGVVMIVGPTGEDFTYDALLPLGAAFLYALSGVMARMLDEGVPSPLINLYSTVVSVIGAVLLTLFTGGFSVLDGYNDLGWIVAMGCLGGSAVLVLVISFRMTEQSNLAPFNYFGILIAFILGWIFFGEAPIDDLFPGALLIALSGLLIVLRERRLRRTRISPTT